MGPSWRQRLEARAIAKGRAKGVAWSIMALLQKRGFELSEAQRLILSQCQEIALLETWFLRATEVKSVEELALHSPVVKEPLSQNEKTQSIQERLDEAYQRLVVLLEKRTQTPDDAELKERVRRGFEELQALKKEQGETIKACEKRFLVPLKTGQTN